VVVLLKARCYADGREKTWLFTNIHQVEVVQGRLHLIRDGYGLVLDMPCEEVEQVYVADQEAMGSMAEA